MGTLQTWPKVTWGDLAACQLLQGCGQAAKRGVFSAECGPLGSAAALPPTAKGQL